MDVPPGVVLDRNGRWTRIVVTWEGFSGAALHSATLQMRIFVETSHRPGYRLQHFSRSASTHELPETPSRPYTCVAGSRRTPVELYSGGAASLVSVHHYRSTSSAAETPPGYESAAASLTTAPVVCRHFWPAGASPVRVVLPYP